MAAKLDSEGRVWVRAPNNSGCEQMHEVTSIRHALASMCLLNQEYGFWPELPRTLRVAAEKLRVLTDDHEAWVDLDRAANIVESLLPTKPV